MNVRPESNGGIMPRNTRLYLVWLCLLAAPACSKLSNPVSTDTRVTPTPVAAAVEPTIASLSLNLPGPTERPTRVRRPEVVLPLVQTITLPAGERRLHVVGFAPAEGLKSLLDANGSLSLTTLRSPDGLEVLAIDGDRLTVSLGECESVLNITDVLRPTDSLPTMPLHRETFHGAGSPENIPPANSAARLQGGQRTTAPDPYDETPAPSDSSADCKATSPAASGEGPSAAPAGFHGSESSSGSAAS